MTGRDDEPIGPLAVAILVLAIFGGVAIIMIAAALRAAFWIVGR